MLGLTAAMTIRVPFVPVAEAMAHVARNAHPIAERVMSLTRHYQICMQLCQIGGMSFRRATLPELARWSAVKVSGWASRDDGHVWQYSPELIPKSGEAGHAAWERRRD